MFRLLDHEYDVTYANLELFAARDDTVCWGVKITAKSRGGSDGMADWRPAILSDALLRTKPGQMSHWYEIAGNTVEWDEPNEDPQALFEVDETSAIYQCRWQFLPEPGNTRVRLILDGMTDIDADHEKVSFHVDVLLGVAPWSMAARSQQECLARYHRLGFKDPVEFRVIGTVSSLVFLDQ